MKKIIRNKIYDTDKATKIFEWENDLQPEHPQKIKETLYYKRTGEYFLSFYGGKETNYALRKGVETLPNEGVIPLTYKQALKWGENKIPETILTEKFAEIYDDESDRIGQTFTLPKNQIIILRRLRDISGKNLNMLMEELLNEKLKEFEVRILNEQKSDEKKN